MGAQCHALIVLVLCGSILSSVQCQSLTNSSNMTTSSVSNKTVAIQNLLSYYGINDTDFLPGQLYCPPTGSLNNTYKQKRILIGVLGCSWDPFLFTLTNEQLSVLASLNRSHDHEEGCYPNLPGYSPPIPEYLLALLNHLEEYNTRSDILPYHRLCVLSGISAELTDNIKAAFSQYLEESSTLVVIDALSDQNSLFLQHVLLPFSIPVLRHGGIGNLSPIRGHDVWKSVSALINNRPSTISSRQVLSAAQLFSSNFFTASPEGVDIYLAIVELAKKFGWRQMACILADDWSVSRLSHGYIRQYSGPDLTVYFLGYNQRGSNLLNLFKSLSQYEVQVIVFHGTVQRYLDTLLEAAQYEFIGPSYVWIYPYFGVIFPDNYDIHTLWCAYTDQEVYTIKNALRGSLAVGILEGLGDKYRSFLEEFLEFADRVTGFGDSYRENAQFPQTSLVHDLVGFLVTSFNALVSQKALDTNTTESLVNVTYEDRFLLNSILLNGTYDDATTGNLSFSADGERSINYISIRNFVPVENNFTVNNSRSLNPWIVQSRVCIVISPTDDLVHFSFFDENGMSSSESTIVFADGTTAVPPDRPIRVFRRSTMRTAVTTTLSTVLFIILVFIYVIMIYYQDKKREMYSSSWIFNEGDLHYIASDGQGIWGRLNNISKLTGFKSNGAKEEAARLNDGSVAVLIRLPLTKHAITQKVYQECNILRELKHPNVCPFYGCLLEGPKSALLYKYYSRGTLHYILNNSEIDFQSVFRLSFAVDVAHGMEYLHSKKIVHGRLKTKTCVVDDNWIVRLRDYGLEDLHPSLTSSQGPRQHQMPQRKNFKISSVKIAPEIRLLGSSFSLAADIFSFGHLLQDLISGAKDDTSNQEKVFHKKGSHSTETKDGIPPKFFRLIYDCLDNRPQSRPSFESIIARLKQMALRYSSDILQDDNTIGVMQVYSRQLEERLEELSDRVVNQRDLQNEIMQHYIPKAMVEAIKDELDVPIQEYTDVAIVCIELTCTDLLSEQLNSDSIEYVMLTMQKAIEGVTVAFDVKKIHSSGNMWILASGIFGDDGCCVVEAAHAAITVLDTFSGIFLPGLPYVHPTVRVGFHLGSVMSGVIEEPVPQLVAFGKSITTAMNLTFASKNGMILSSWDVGQKLKKNSDFKVTFNGDISICGDKVPTTWVETSSDPSRSCTSTPLRAPTTDKNVTIKQCVRKYTITSSSSINDQSVSPNTLRMNKRSYYTKPKREKSVSLFEKMQTAPPQRRRSSPIHLRLSIDSGFSSSHTPKQSNVQVRERKGVSLACLVKKNSRHWSTASEPTRLASTSTEHDDI